jgi:uncharacterized protein (DUF433 family)
MARVADKSQRARIVRDPRVCGGEPTVEGTRVPVSSIVVQWRYYGNLGSVHEAFPHLDISAIETALGYYKKHQAEIDELIESNEREAYAAE